MKYFIFAMKCRTRKPNVRIEAEIGLQNDKIEKHFGIDIWKY